jgi:hypothetical protein
MIKTHYFFSLFCLSKSAKKFYHLAKAGPHLITSGSDIHEVFLNNMRSLLREEVQTLQLNPHALCTSFKKVHTLQESFSSHEINVACMNLTRNKASRPDCLPNEILLVHWQTLKHYFYTHDREK